MSSSVAAPQEVEGRTLSAATLVLLAACHFAAFADRALPAVFAPYLKAEFGLSDVQIGAIQGPAFVVIFVFGALLSGHGANRLPTRAVLVGCILTWSVGSLLFALASDYGDLLAGRVILGLGQAAFAPMALAWLASAVPAHRLGRATSIFTAGSAAGRSGALIVGGLLLGALSAGPLWAGMEPWRLAAVLTTLPNFILAALLWRRLAGAAPATAPGGLVRALRRLAANPLGLGLHFLAGGLAVLLIQAAGGWAPSIVNRSLGLDPALAALLVGATVIVAAPAGHLTAGRVLDLLMSRGRGPAAIVCVGSGLAVAGAVLLAWAPGPVQATGGLSLISFGGGGAALAVLAALGPLSPVALRPSMLALYLAFVGAVGTGLGPWVTGLVSDALFPGSQGLGLALLTVVGAAGIAAALIALVANGAWRRLAGRVAGGEA